MMSIKPIPGIKKIIAFASGKGGVGKTTTAVNVAIALQQLGNQVGLLDADIHGPNVPAMLGVMQKPEQIDKKLVPVEAHGLKTMSMGYLLNKNTPAIWRGPMVSSALEQLLTLTLWGELDYLVIDLPPGTGDIQLTLSKKVPVSAAVIVTTPQEIALLDARRGLEMFRKVNVYVAGIVENMSDYHCPQCGHQAHIFGEQGAAPLAKSCDTQVLGRIPLDPTIRRQSDGGKPAALLENVSEKKPYQAVAKALVHTLSLRPKSFQDKFNIDIVKE